MKRVRVRARVRRWAWLLLLALAPAWALPDYAAVRASHRPSDIELLDRHGQPLQTVRVDPGVRRGPWLHLADLSPAMREAIVLSEDRQFWAHGGIDWSALAASAWGNAWNQRTRGASTVTMQLAGLLDDALARPAAGRSVVQKVQQMALARELESRWRKTQILEAYLNLVPLRGEAVGVPAAAQLLFGKHASGLDRLEAALLAALVRSPNAASAAVMRRACELLRQQRLPCDGLETLAAQAFARKPGALGGEASAPHFARRWLASADPGSNSKIAPKTTLDAALQRLALAALRQQIAELRGRDVDDGAVIVLDNRSGEVLAWVGSAGPASGAGEVDAVLARRQPGSTLKPFVYGLALDQRLITPASLLHDAPLQLASGNDAYQPQNFDHAYRGWVTAREALASSLNVPAVRVGAMLGADALFDGLNRAGLRLRENGGFHGHALALGTAEVSLLDLANAYRMLANRGLWSPVRLVPAQAAPRRVLSAATAASISAILADGTARAASFGFDSPLVTRRFAAVKTGTSKDLRDNWCIGYTERYTVGVWVGNASGAPMHGVSGVTGAAPVWRRIVDALPPEPARVASELPPARAAAVRPASDAAFRIRPVSEGSVLALDPDIPLHAQQILLSGPSGAWLIDGRPVGHGSTVRWQLAPGRHRVEVRGPDDRALDSVRFEVRPGLGASPVRPRRG